MDVTGARRIVVLGAGGRDFHDFNVVFRDDPSVEVVAFTAAQIPGIDDRAYPPSLAGARYPRGIPIRPESELAEIVTRERVDEVVLAYSDLSHAQVMHKASLALAAGADFRLLGPRATMLVSAKPVIAVCAVRTGAGKSPTSRRVARILRESGLSVALVRHPMPYGDLEAMRAQRFGTLAELDAAGPTVEEREEYEQPIALGIPVFAGVDYGEILGRAEAEADVVLWDGGNNDFPFYRPDLLIAVADPLRAGDELSYYPGEAVLRMADVVLVNKVDSAAPADLERVLADVAAVNPAATVIRAESPVALEEGPDLRGARVLVVEDGPTLTHGGMSFGAGAVAARAAGAQLVDPRPHAVGTIASTFAAFPQLGPLLPAMGYSPEQLKELERTIASTPCDAVLVGTPIDLGRLIDVPQPLRRVRYEVREVGAPTLADVLAPLLSRLGVAQGRSSA